MRSTAISIAAAGLCFGRLESNTVLLGFFQCLTDLNHLPVKVDAAPAERQHFAKAHAGEQGNHRRDKKTVAAHQLDKGRHVPHDHHFLVVYFRRRLSGGNVLDDQFVFGGVAKRFPKYAVGMADRPWRKPACAIRSAVGSQRGVPFLDIERSQLLQQLGANVRHDLIFDQFAIPGGRPGADIAGGLPTVDADADKLGDGDLVRFRRIWIDRRL